MINRNLDLYQNFFSIVADLENSNFRLTILPRHLSQIMLQSEKFSLQPKTIFFLVQKHYFDSTKRFSRQPKKQLPAGSDLAGYGKYWQYTKLI